MVRYTNYITRSGELLGKDEWSRWTYNKLSNGEDIVTSVSIVHLVHVGNGKYYFNDKKNNIHYCNKI